jgi:hypothetical protein
VAARRPSSSPASARMKAPVHVPATRRHRPKACCTNLIRPGVDGVSSVPPPPISVTAHVVERLCCYAHADLRYGWSRQSPRVGARHRPARPRVCLRVPGGHPGETHQLEAREDDETDAQHGTSPNVLKPPLI